MISLVIMKLKSNKSILPVMLIMTLMTLVFVYIFGVGFSKSYIPKVAIVNHDKSYTSKMLTEKLLINNKYQFKEIALEQSIAAAEKGDVIGYILIDEGFESMLELQQLKVYFYKGSSSIESIALESTINSLIFELLSDQQYSKQLSEALKDEGVITNPQKLYQKLTENHLNYSTYINKASFYQKEEGVRYDAKKNSFSGFLLFFSLFTIMFGIGSIVEEKELQVWNRQMVSPISKSTLIIGNIICNFIVGITQLFLIVLASKYILGIDWGGSTIALISVLAAYTLTGTAIGLFVLGFVNTQQQLAAILPTIIVASSMIGGCMWPVEVMQSKLLKGMAELMPQKWGMSGLTEIIIYNGTIQDVIKPIIILLIMAGVFIMASVLREKNWLSKYK